jgi:hypothetical protein
MKRVIWVAALALVCCASAQAKLVVMNDRTAIEARLGHKFIFHSRIENRSATEASGLVAHLNVLDLTGHTYVDPEDWSSNRTRYLTPIPAGGSTTLTWRMNAVNAGTIGIYVAVLPRSGAPVPPVTGATVRVHIKDRQTLNSGGILPLALGIPAALGLLVVTVRLRRRSYRAAAP